MKWRKTPGHSRTPHDHDRANPTLPPLQSLWVKIKWSEATEPEAQEHDSQLKCQQSCPILTLPLRAAVMLSGDKQFLHFLCLDPITFPTDMIRKEPVGLQFWAPLPLALPTQLVLICIVFLKLNIRASGKTLLSVGRPGFPIWPCQLLNRLGPPCSHLENKISKTQHSICHNKG